MRKRINREKNNRKLSFWVIFAFFLMVGCKDHSIPKDIIPEMKMQDILLEMYIANGVAEKHNRDLEVRRYQRDEIHQGIFENYGVTRDEFKKSYEYYLLHPIYLDSIHRRLTIEIDRRIAKEYEDPRDEYESPANKALKK